MGPVSPDELGFYAELVCSLLADLQVHSNLDLTLDSHYLRKRIENEGLRFLTVVLPSIGKDVDKWLRDEGSQLRLSEFKPCFLRRYLTKLSESVDLQERGYLIRGLRQLGYMYYKLQTSFSESDLQLAEDRFIGVEHELAVLDIPWYKPWFINAGHLIKELLGSSCEDSVKTIYHPRHGPGAVATGEKGVEKWWFRRNFEGIAERFNVRELYHMEPFAVLDPATNSRMEREMTHWVTPVSKLVAVPKDSRGPRLICEEPLELQFLQQWYLQILDHYIEKGPYRRFLSMRDQSRNQELALTGSKTGEWSTLDLKDASDRVSVALVANLFPRGWYDDFRVLRSQYVQTWSRLIKTSKFAPMGSAICFPIESIVFWAIAQSVSASLPEARDCAEQLCSVFGDDIIIRPWAVEAVTGALTECGLVVNTDKSYTSGRFRESCGMDAYAGFPVAPVRVKRSFPASWKDTEGLSNWVAVHNGLLSNCFFTCSDAIKRRILDVAPLLCSGTASSLSLDGSSPSRKRMNKRLQREEVLTYLISTVRHRFDDPVLRHRRSMISPVVEGDPEYFSLPRQTRTTVKWVRTIY